MAWLRAALKALLGPSMLEGEEGRCLPGVDPMTVWETVWSYWSDDLREGRELRQQFATQSFACESESICA